MNNQIVKQTVVVSQGATSTTEGIERIALFNEDGTPVDLSGGSGGGTGPTGPPGPPGPPGSPGAAGDTGAAGAAGDTGAAGAAGDTGAAGAAGAVGAPGGDTFVFTFNSATSGAPGEGCLLLNANPQYDSTSLSISWTNAAILDVTAWIGALAVGSIIKLFNLSNPNNASIWTIAGPPTSVGSGATRYYTIPLTFVQTLAPLDTTASDLAVSYAIQGPRAIRRVLALSANSATPAINTDNYDMVHITAQTADITGFVMTGTPEDGDALHISITGTAEVHLTFGVLFEAGAAALPNPATTTRIDAAFLWNTETSKWRCMAAG